MPTYVYQCKECETVFEKNVKYDNRDDIVGLPCNDCGGYICRIPAMPGFAYDNVGPGKRPDAAFTDHLKEMKKKYPGSSMNIM